MSTPESPAATPESHHLRRFLTAAVFLVFVVGVLWIAIGQRLWDEFQEYQARLQEAEDSAPVGYIGLHYRRTYNDRPAVFHSEKDGRKQLWASVGGDDGPEFYDVTDADFPVQGLSGGFGRDSIPGIDYPILETPSSERGQRLRSRQEVFGVALAAGPRAYPKELLAKIEMANDQDGETPIVVVYDRGHDRLLVCKRMLDGRAFTFGTTGYSSEQKPLLYDRPTRSLWLPADSALVCVNGERKGTELPADRQATRMTWSEWLSEHPQTRILFGNDRSRPIPDE